MPARSFLDTNVLVYTDDGDEPEKQAAALDLVEQLRLAGSGVVSTQVLQEYFVIATRKLAVPGAIARRKVELLARFEVVLPDVELVLAAIDLNRLHEISFWDALIVSAAKAANCATLYTEDLQGGASLAGLEIVNPFASGPGHG